MEAIRVLIVDDIDGYAEILASRLEHTGWAFVTATSGMEALRLLQGSEPIDVLATDFLMPELDGAQLVNRALALKPDLYTIVFTAWNDRDYAVKSLSVGADAFLDKTDYLDSELEEAIRLGVQRITLSRIGRQLLEVKQEDQIFEHLFAALGRLRAFDGCCLAVRGASGDVCRVERAIDLKSGKELPAGVTVDEDSAYRYVIENGTAYLPPIFQPERHLTSFQPESHSIVVVPLTLYEGESGALGIEHHEENRLGIDDLHFLSQIVDWISMAMAKLTQQKLLLAEQKRVLAEQKRVLDERERSEIYREYLARAVLHEIKNSLHGLELVADVEGEKLDPENREVLRGGIDRINAAVNKILRPLIREDELPDQVDPGAVVREAVERFGDFRSLPSPRLRSEVQPILPTIDGNRELLVQALLNLLENGSAAAAARDDGEVAVQISYSEARDRVELVVEDNGEGISAEDYDHIFDYGYSKRGKDHSGIGLALTKDIVTLHSGRIDVMSQPGKGTCFRLSFPPASSTDDSEAVR